MFEIFSGGADGASSLSKDAFVEAVQSMDIKTAVEDINELFNYID